jgi:hypothetical protein
VAYVNIPRPFVAGAVYSPNEDICLENVTVVLTAPATGLRHETQTDFMGEFRISNIQAGIYDISLSKPGYASKRLKRIDVREAVNVEEIRLYPAR